MIVLIRLLLQEIKEFKKLRPSKPNLCHIRGSLMSTTSILDNGFAKKMFVSIGYSIFFIDYTKTMNDIIILVCMFITFCNMIYKNQHRFDTLRPMKYCIYIFIPSIFIESKFFNKTNGKISFWNSNNNRYQKYER